MDLPQKAGLGRKMLRPSSGGTEFQGQPRRVFGPFP